MTVTTSWNLNAAVLMVAMVGIGSCARGPVTSGCRIGDLTASPDPESSKLAAAWPWTKHVRECDVGEYKIDVPAEGGHGEILVSRNGHALFLSAGETTIVMDSSGRRVLFDAVLAEGLPGAPSVSYATHVGPTDAWVENVDLGADGTVDYRTTETAGGAKKREFSVDQRWLEVVRRGDHDGVVLDGEFMTAAAARERLAAKRKQEAGGR